MHDLLGSGFLAATVQWGGWKRTGNFTAIDLIAATTNALNGALFAQRRGAVQWAGRLGQR